MNIRLYQVRISLKNYIWIINLIYKISHYLGPNGNIIIYGGGKASTHSQFIKAEPDLIILNTRELPFEWTVPLKVSSNIGVVPSLKAHTANLIDNYMIVAFGN